jgi:hypothetical protein
VRGACRALECDACVDTKCPRTRGEKWPSRRVMSDTFDADLCTNVLVAGRADCCTRREFRTYRLVLSCGGDWNLTELSRFCRV